VTADKTSCADVSISLVVSAAIENMFNNINFNLCAKYSEKETADSLHQSKWSIIWSKVLNSTRTQDRSQSRDSRSSAKNIIF